MNIKTILFELTTRCNLKCPYCYRTLFGPFKNVDFDMDLLKNVPLEDDRLRSYVICGTVGDSIFYPKLKEFIKECKRRNPRLRMSFCTNGSAYDKEWWIDLADILKGVDHNIIFGIDGFEETYKLHRINGNYEKVMSNMRTFIDAGGIASWQFILFKHNEHELLKASSMSRELGCREFIVRKSFIFDELNRPDLIPGIKTRTELSDIESDIKCRIDDGEVSVLANGKVMPCCHLIEPHEKLVGFTSLNLKDKHLYEIVENGYIQKIWNKRYELSICQKCKSRHNSFSIEQFILQTIKARKKLDEQH